MYLVHVATIPIPNYVVGHSFVSSSTKINGCYLKCWTKYECPIQYKFFKVLEPGNYFFPLKFINDSNVTS